MTTDEESAAAAGASTSELPIRGKDAGSFDIVQTYHRLLADDPDLTMPVAAIEALIELLGQSHSSTVFETMDLVKAQSERLRAAVTNPIPLSHGTDLFQQYLLMSLKQPGPGGKETASSHENFEVVRQHLLKNGRLFAQRAKAARENIAVQGRRYVRDGCTILTHGGSRVVATLLERAADKSGHDRPRRFRVIHVMNEARMAESSKAVAALRAKGIPVATIPESAVAYSMSKADMVFVGAEAVTANGGIISRMGTYQIALLAQAHKKEFFVAAERHKFGRTFPLTQFDYDFDQHILDFQAGEPQESGEKKPQPMADPIDYTRPDLITAIFVEDSVLAPSAVAKEIIDLTVS